MTEKTLRPAEIEIILEMLSRAGEVGTAWSRFAPLEMLMPFCRSRL